jgi:hypothetical protein
MRNMVVGGLALVAAVMAGSPAAAQIVVSEGATTAFFYPEDWDGNDLTGEGYVYLIDWTTGTEGWATFQFDPATGAADVWDEIVSEAPERRRFYGGVACHDHPGQNRRFGEVVRKAFSAFGPSFLGSLWRCAGEGPACLVENAAINLSTPIIWDIGWYAWTCYRP